MEVVCGIRKKLMEVHTLFLDSIVGSVLGEVLVGTVSFGDDKVLTSKSDLDIICIVEKKNLKLFLESKYLKGLMSSELANKILDKKIADYLVLKAHINGILISVDVITPTFFKKMCNINLCDQKKPYLSWKYGNKPQTNKYDTSEFNGDIHMMQKECKKNKEGYYIGLPLFFINKGRYIRGIPTVKYLTHKIYYDPTGFVKKNISKLHENIILRLIYEYPLISKEKLHDYFLNLLKNRHKFNDIYRNKLLKEVDVVLERIKWKKK